LTGDAELVRAAHLNMVGFFRHSAETTDGGTLEERDGAMLAGLGAQLPFLNDVVPVGQVGDPDALLARADELFSGRSAGWVVLTREGDAVDDPLRAACDARGLAFQERYPTLVCTERIAEPAAVAGSDLRRVDDEDAARSYWDLCNRSYTSLGFPPDTFSHFPAALLLEDATTAFIAYREGTPVACALGWLDDGVAFLGWVATAEQARGTGLGALVTAAVTNDGFDRGAEFVSLQASPMGLSVYLRLGYREISNYNVHTRRY
jgi:GNAT superfamily N-acetyltransferase